jgi:hypothetical protein
MNSPKHLGRRGFVAATLFAAGGSLGWLARRSQTDARPKLGPSTGLDPRFAYDISEYERVDPKLLRHAPAGEFPTGFGKVKRLAASRDGHVWVAGDRAARLFTPAGKQLKEFPFESQPHALRETEEGQLFVAFARAFEVYDSSGTRLMRSPRLGETTFITSLAVHGRTVYLADAGQREVIICDRESGDEIDRFGKRDAGRNNPGFEVPSPYFDLAVAGDGRLRIVNPSRLRVETYSLDGRFLSSWGQAGMQIDRFCGCCNPVYFALAANGDFITSEKGLTRVKMFGSDGQFKGVVAGPDRLVEDKEMAKRACEDCSVGAGFDVAVDPQNNVFVLDPFRKVVRKFVPVESAPT